jgi:hypothetical protein
MRDSERYRGVADDMLRRAQVALTAGERVSYLELAAGWRKLETEAAAFEAKSAPAPSPETVIPFGPDPSEPESR